MHKYRFRVVAVNKIGPSDPGEMKGDDILMKDPWGKCKHTPRKYHSRRLANFIFSPLQNTTFQSDGVE